MVAVFDELMAGWERFLELEPWDSVGRDEVFSVEDEASGETHYAVVLGSAGTEYGFSLARGAAGLRTLGALIEEDIGRDEAALSGDMLSITVHEGAFPAPFRKFLRDAVGPRKSLRGLPLIFASDAGRTPRPPREEEMGLLSRAVRAVTELIGRSELKPEPFRPGGPMPCIVLRKEGEIELKEVTPAFERPRFAEARIPEERLAALRALPRLDRAILVSCSIAPISIQGAQVRVFLALDPVSQLILEGSPVMPGEIDEAAGRLFDAFEKLGGLPSEIRTDSRFFYEGVKSALAGLGIRTLCLEEIPRLAEVRESLVEFLSSLPDEEGRGRSRGGS